MDGPWKSVWKKSRGEYLALARRGLDRDAQYLFLERTLPVEPEGPPPSLLEAGAGSGLRSLWFARRFGVRVILVDREVGALDLAGEIAAIFGAGTAFRVMGDAFHLPLPDGAVDFCISLGLNEHWVGEARRRLFLEMARVCRKRCVVVVPNRWDLLYRLRKARLEAKGAWPYGLEVPFGLAELRRAMETAGLSVIRSERIVRSTKLRRIPGTRLLPWIPSYLGCVGVPSRGPQGGE